MKKNKYIIITMASELLSYIEQDFTRPFNCYSKAYQQLILDKEEIKNHRLTLENFVTINFRKTM